ncbi:MAG: hypothetical protein WKF78_11590 [Candidatus Limnocylindrales bacterium]
MSRSARNGLRKRKQRYEIQDVPGYAGSPTRCSPQPNSELGSEDERDRQFGVRKFVG